MQTSSDKIIEGIWRCPRHGNVGKELADILEHRRKNECRQTLIKMDNCILTGSIPEDEEKYLKMKRPRLRGYADASRP